MPEESSPGEATPSEADDATDASTTPGGYAYTVVDDGAASTPMPPGQRRGIPPIWLAVAAIVPAILVGAIVWFVASSGGGSDAGRTQKDVANVVSVFSSSQDGSVSTRYEGELPPGIPDVPAYPGAKVVSSQLQIRGNDASYLVIYDTPDDRATVAAYLADQFKADPWQIDAGQDSKDSTLHQFTKIDDPDVTGLVLVSEATGADLTTIIESLQVVAGAKNAGQKTFVPAESRPLPEGFPETIPAYDGSILIQSAFQKAAGGSQYAVSYITKDPQAGVMTFFRTKLADAQLTVTDGDATQSSLESAERIDFADATQALTGVVTTGKFAEDPSYTRIDVQAQVTAQ